MSKHGYLGMRQDDLKGKRYARFWNPQMQPMQSHVQEAVLHGAFASGLGLSMEQLDLLLEPGYLDFENGYTQLSNGQYLVACLTKMPNVTGEMFEWWMGWHYMEAQRYKLWHPQSHLLNSTKEMQGDNPGLSDREKYQTSHFVREYMGNNAADITITFSPATEYFKNTSDPYSDEITALVCGKIALRKLGLKIGNIVHQIRQVNGGAEMRSRFWLGQRGFPGAGTLNNLIMPKGFPRDVLVHCAMEMNHLAGFLPELYAEYHD